MLTEFPPPALQIAGVHLQCARHLSYALSAFQATHRRLFEFLCEFPANFHFPVFPFNDFQGLTGCLKNGVHSKRPSPERLAHHTWVPDSFAPAGSGRGIASADSQAKRENFISSYLISQEEFGHIDRGSISDEVVLFAGVRVIASRQ